MNAVVLLTVATALSVGRPPAADEAPNDAIVGRTIDDFHLQDFRGTAHRLSDWSERRAVVVVFLGVECPLAKLYGPRLAELAERFDERGVQFVGIDSNQQDTLAEIAHYARAHELPFPILKDAGNRVADQFGARRTPEAFLLDDQRVVRYWGRIDDQFGVGYARAEVNDETLARAIDQLLSGHPITDAMSPSVGCHIGRVVRREPTGDVTYSKQIARILQHRCVKCHRADQVAPFSLTSYDEVVGWAETILEVIAERRMPPWHASPDHGSFSNDARLTDDERRMIDAWVANGVPEGDPNDLPSPLEFHDEWRIPEPDAVFEMPRAFQVPAQGIVEYQYFVVDPGFTEDKWVRAAEARPGSPSVVHHMILFYVPPRRKFQPLDALMNSIAAFVPGMPASNYAPGFARRIPAGSNLVFQMHYTPNGREQQDVSKAGLVFADPTSIEKEIKTQAVFNFQFSIPPHADDYPVQANYRFRQDSILYSLTPHMHLRGKSFRYTARYPDGAEEVLLDVPRYDFNWQNIYFLAEPKPMPEGTQVVVEGRFDNSDGNLGNPDPTARVTWGDQTWNEMMIGSFAVALADQDLRVGRPRVRRAGENRFEVTFRYRPSQDVSSVHLAGTFNNSQADAQPLQGPDAEGFYSTTIELEEGSYEYKFVLDGSQWKHDPGNPDQDGFFNNSVLRVSD